MSFENAIFREELFISQQPFLVNRSVEVGPQEVPVHSKPLTLKRCCRIRR